MYSTLTDWLLERQRQAGAGPERAALVQRQLWHREPHCHRDHHHGNVSSGSSLSLPLQHSLSLPLSLSPSLSLSSSLSLSLTLSLPQRCSNHVLSELCSSQWALCVSYEVTGPAGEAFVFSVDEQRQCSRTQAGAEGCVCVCVCVCVCMQTSVCVPFWVSVV